VPKLPVATTATSRPASATAETATVPAQALPASSRPSKKTRSTRTKEPLTAKDRRRRRLSPDRTVLFKRILKWSPPPATADVKPGETQAQGVHLQGKLKNSGDAGKIPSLFEDISEVLYRMAPHVLNEGLAQVNNDLPKYLLMETMEAKTCKRLDKKSSPTTLYEVTFYTENYSNLRREYGDIYLLHSAAWSSPYCLGIYDVSRRTANPTHLPLLLCASANYAATGWLADADARALAPTHGAPAVGLAHLGTAITSLREYDALKSLEHLDGHLQSLFLRKFDRREEPVAPPPAEEAERPAGVREEAWEHIRRSVGDADKLAVIRDVVDGEGKAVHLLQGPPGTGKSMTIVHLVSALLNGTKAKKKQGIKVQVGNSLRGAGEGRRNAAAPDVRILICAPSNCATDDLAWKIKRRSLGPSGLRGDLVIRRFGVERVRAPRAGAAVSSPPASSEKRAFLADIDVGRRVNRALDAENRGPLRNGVPTSSGYAVERRRILSGAHVVCCTLNSAGSRAFVDAAAREGSAGGDFDVVVVDEACQASEPSTLIPLKYNPERVVLVGDPRQLPVTLLCHESEEGNLGRSLFERLYYNNWPVRMLQTQYRMHPDISKMSSEMFYGGKVGTSRSVVERNWKTAAPWTRDVKFPPFCIWDMEGLMLHHPETRGRSNKMEEDFIVGTMLPDFLQHYGNARTADAPLEIGIISFYKEQVFAINNRISLLPKTKTVSFDVATVDSFQGERLQQCYFCFFRPSLRSQPTEHLEYLLARRVGKRYYHPFLCEIQRRRQ